MYLDLSPQAGHSGSLCRKGLLLPAIGWMTRNTPARCPSATQNTDRLNVIWFQQHKGTSTYLTSSHAKLFSGTIFLIPHSLITAFTWNTLSLWGNNFLKQLTVTLNSPVQEEAFYQTSHEIHFGFLPLVCQKPYVTFNKILQMSMLITKQHDISNSEKAENQKQLY